MVISAFSHFPIFFFPPSFQSSFSFSASFSPPNLFLPRMRRVLRLDPPQPVFFPFSLFRREEKVPWTAEATCMSPSGRPPPFFGLSPLSFRFRYGFFPSRKILSHSLIQFLASECPSEGRLQVHAPLSLLIQALSPRVPPPGLDSLPPPSG